MADQYAAVLDQSVGSIRLIDHAHLRLPIIPASQNGHTLRTSGADNAD